MLIKNLNKPKFKWVYKTNKKLKDEISKLFDNSNTSKELKRFLADNYAKRSLIYRK